MNWHERYLQQARWTRDIRQYLYQQVGITNPGFYLEVGCGTGALLNEWDNNAGILFGLDINIDNLQQAADFAPACHLIQGDAHHLPYASDTFNITFCHFLLLWVTNPLGALIEMQRVTRPGGAVIALAEPDYNGRIDYPGELEILADWQGAALRRQGANPGLGRQLASLFRQSGLQLMEYGLLGGQWRGEDLGGIDKTEWQVLREDLASLEMPPDPTLVELLQHRELEAQQKGERILFVPTWYAWGKVFKP